MKKFAYVCHMNSQHTTRRDGQKISREPMEIFASCSRRISPILIEELKDLGIDQVVETGAGVRFSGDLATAYKVILWSRVASRVLVTVGRFKADNPQALYEGIREIDWSQHLDFRKTIAVDFTSTLSAITHTQFGAFRVKDAVVDQFRMSTGERPSVDAKRPDLRINVHLHKDLATVAIDLSGDSLHKRGYRQDGGVAPLKETLAAAILLRANWPSVARIGGPLIDPMCGSGTLVIEGALIAGKVAPGLLRNYYGFLGWKGHDRSLWAGIVGEAKRVADKGKQNIPPILGTDHHPKAIEYARANVSRAGMAGYIKIEQREMVKARPPMRTKAPGMIAVNPPYGERIGEEDKLLALYQELGGVLKKRFGRYKVALFTGNPDVAKNIGLGKRKTNTFFNGAIECKLFQYEVE